MLSQPPPPPPQKKIRPGKILALLASWSFPQKPTAKVGIFQFKRFFPFLKTPILNPNIKPNSEPQH